MPNWTETRSTKVVFARTGWMHLYGLRGEPNGPLRGGSFNEHSTGSEVENFRVGSGKLLGFVQVGKPNRTAFNLRRIGPGDGDQQRENVLVALFATAEAGGQRLVGWYDHATCHARYRDRRGHGVYNFDAAAADAVLLPLSQRTFAPPNRQAGGFGTSHVRYARNDNGDPARLPWMREAVAWIRRYVRRRGPNLLTGPDPGVPAETEATVSSEQGRLADAEARSAVELRAMAVAETFFTGRGYAVENVHRNSSYDLCCTKGQTSLRVEVKGSTGPLSRVTLTRNEVRSARDKKTTTALFVVSDIEISRPRDKWVAAGGTATWIADWVPQTSDLEVTEYRYTLPAAMRRAEP